MSSRIYQNFIDERMFRYLLLVSSSCKSDIETRVEGVVNKGDSIAFSLMPKSSGARVNDVNPLSTLTLSFFFLEIVRFYFVNASHTQETNVSAL